MRPAQRSDGGTHAAPPRLELGALVGFDYELPRDRIAQYPTPERDAARLLVVRRKPDEEPVDSAICALPQWLRRGDLLVVNRSRVIPARLHGRRLPGGGALEMLLLAPQPGRAGAADVTPGMRCGAPSAGLRWRALARPGRRLRVGQRVVLAPRSRAACAGRSVTSDGAPEIEVLVAAVGEGWVEVAFPPETDVLSLVAAIGETPLPPYIRRPHGPTPEDGERYQTVFAIEPGSIAAPTAGLHLSARVLGALAEAGVRVAHVVLHVGPATFLAGQPGRPALAVEPERYSVPRETRDAIAAVRGRGRVIAVGTTTTRALESAARADWREGQHETDLVLAPGVEFRVIDGLLTNFHLPQSSLLALVAAFAGEERTRRAYARALERGYRFYSYGDAMLIL